MEDDQKLPATDINLYVGTKKWDTARISEMEKIFSVQNERISLHLPAYTSWPWWAISMGRHAEIPPTFNLPLKVFRGVVIVLNTAKWLNVICNYSQRLSQRDAFINLSLAKDLDSFVNKSQPVSHHTSDSNRSNWYVPNKTKKAGHQPYEING